MKVYLALDPVTRDVRAEDAAITAEPEWPRRELTLTKGEWAQEGDRDRLARDWWDRSRPEGAPLWPLLP